MKAFGAVYIVTSWFYYLLYTMGSEPVVSYVQTHRLLYAMMIFGLIMSGLLLGAFIAVLFMKPKDAPESGLSPGRSIAELKQLERLRDMRAKQKRNRAVHRLY